jgi:hypothetical protein
MHGSSKIPSNKSRQAALRVGFLIPALKGYLRPYKSFAAETALSSTLTIKK